jgi:hypothetical protein
MKRLLIVLSIIVLIFAFVTTCTPESSPEVIEEEAEPEIVTDTIIETITETVVVTEYIEDTECKEELQKYKDLINNLNEYLGYVYYVECTNAIGGIGDATAFSIDYNDEIYLISAGHLVENENGIFGNFRIGGISIVLLTYNNDYMNKTDYAIFTSSEIDNGFEVDLDSDKPLFLIGDSIWDYTRKTVEGESGSPVIDIDGEVTEIATTDLYYYNTDIDIVLEAIDNIQ